METPEVFHVKPIKCKTPRQKELLKAIDENTIIFSEGVAGVGKSFCSCYKALKMLEKGQIEKIVLVKSVTTLEDEQIGFLKGSVSEKIFPFMISFFDNIDQIIGKETREQLIKDGRIEILPLAFVRGITIAHSCVLIQESQNLSIDTFRSIITRIGEGSKFVFDGDSQQIDFKYKGKSVYKKVLEAFKDTPEVGIVKFEETDCVRNPLIPVLLDKIKEIE